MNPPATATTLLTTTEAAARLRVSRRTVERLVATRKLARTDVGTVGVTRIPDWAIEEYIARNTHSATKAKGRG